MKTIPLTQGYVASVDDADYEQVSKFKWHAVRNGERWYAARRIGPRSFFLHQVLLPRARQVDHKDGDGLNCQRSNLRRSSFPENGRAFRRKSPGKSSKFRGVSKDSRSGKWLAQLKKDGKTKHLGYFDSEIDAAKAFDSGSKFYGFDPASLNFP